jgi:coenzyme F420-reducing hydrogenase beta subunit
MSIKIGITAANFSGNKGAAAMLQSIIKNVINEKEKAEFSLFSVYPKEDNAQNPYSFLNIISAKPERIIFIAFPLAILFRLFKWVKFIKKLLLMNKIIDGFYKCDLVVDAAGISFVDSRGFIMNTYNFICAATPLLVGTPVIKASQAMGPCNKIYNKIWAKIALRKIKAVCARGKYTEEYLTNLGLANIISCADCAFIMPDGDESKNKVKEIMQKDKFFDKKFITLSISSVVFKSCEKAGIDYFDIMKRFIKYINNKGYGVFIIANAARKGTEKLKNNDLPIGEKLYGMIDNNKDVRWYNKEFTPEIIREIISKSNILVASRFHAMIGALEKGVPVLLVGWSHKYKEVLDMFDLEEYSVDYKNLHYEDLVERFEKVLDEEDNIKQKIHNNIAEVKKSSYKNIKVIIDEINSIESEKYKYLGKMENSYACYSNDKEIRRGAASGGAVTATLIYMLENKNIDGALVSKQYIKNGKIKVSSFIATTKEEILDCQTSIYTNFNLKHSFKSIKEFKGQVAVVCLPCHLNGLNALRKKEGFKEKIKYNLCLFCGGIAEERLMERILEKNDIDINQVKRIYSRKGHWRGKTVIEMDNGNSKEISYKYNLSTYKNAFYYSSPKCFVCADNFGYESDISFGDIWLKEMKKEDIKHTAIITRTKEADDVINKMINNKVLSGKEFCPSKIEKGNKRALIYKFKTAQARSIIGERYGLKGAKTFLDKSKWNHTLVSKIIIKNMIRSKDEYKMNRTFKKNRKLMFLYMGLIRVLLSF